MQISFIKRKVHFVYIILGVVSMLLAGFSYVRAEETTDLAPETSGRSVEMREAAANRLAGLREEQQNRFINLVRNAVGRMEAAIIRLENIGGRIETRIEKLNADGFSVEPAQKPLTDARAKLAEAKSRLAQAKNDAEDGLISETPRERFAAARAEFIAVRDLIREAFILLRESLAELNDAVIEHALNGQPATAAVVKGADVTQNVNQ